MKQNIFSQKKSQPGNRLLSWLLLTAFIILSAGTQKVKAQDPFTRLKQAALAAGQPQTTELTKVTVSSANPIWKAVSLTPIKYVPFPMEDATGKALLPTDMVTLKNGKKMTALDYFTQVNDVEKKLNAQGYSLRNGPATATVSKMVTSSADLDGKVSSLSTSVGAFRSEDNLKTYMSTEKKVGSLTLKPLDKYTSAEKATVTTTKFAVASNIISIAGIITPPVESVTHTATVPTLLKTIDQTDTKEWGFGSPSTFQAGIRGSLTKYAKIYNYDPEQTNLNEYRLSADGKVFGTLLNHTLDLLNGSGEFYAPADTRKNMTAKLVIKLIGVSVLNLSESYSSSKIFSQTKAKSTDLHFSIEVPIVAGINFSGTIGVRGSVGLECSAELYRSYVTMRAKPIAEISGYAEAGVSVLGIIEIGVGGSLTFIKGDLDLEGCLGIWSMSTTQTVVFSTYYFGYDLNMLSGNLYAYADINYIFGTKRFEHELFNWSGFKKSGTIAEGSNYYTLNY